MQGIGISSWCKDRLSSDCRSTIDRMSTDIAVDIAVNITYSKHDPDIFLKGYYLKGYYTFKGDKRRND